MKFLKSHDWRILPSQFHRSVLYLLRFPVYPALLPILRILYNGSIFRFVIRIQISKTLSLFVNYLIYLAVGTDNTQYLISFSITQRVVSRQKNTRLLRILRKKIVPHRADSMIFANKMRYYVLRKQKLDVCFFNQNSWKIPIQPTKFRQTKLKNTKLN